MSVGDGISSRLSRLHDQGVIAAIAEDRVVTKLGSGLDIEDVGGSPSDECKRFGEVGILSEGITAISAQDCEDACGGSAGAEGNGVGVAREGKDLDAGNVVKGIVEVCRAENGKGVDVCSAIKSHRCSECLLVV